jgi:hypothetical protein
MDCRPQPRRSRRGINRRSARRRPRAPQALCKLPGPGDDNALWSRLEECEEGRLAQEADHLFDTSYAWAA